MDSSTIRQRFITFFLERGHTQLPSLPLVPNDPSITTLFTIAGMQQMIKFFLGQENPPNRRLVTVQKTIRTVDIDEVGDESHLTFFEMLGNFSVGDYFKAQSIAYTWEFLTGTLGLPTDRWRATIYPGDEESRQAWIAVGLPAERVVETEENWWAQGPTGPCGPDSEIFWDWGAEFGCGHPDCNPVRECCDRYIEVWNNVFMTKIRDEDGSLRDLPWNNVDTGMGFERLVAVVQGHRFVYDTDLYQPIIQTVVGSGAAPYGSDSRSDRSLRIIADHSNAITFMVADGVMPSAEGRGYVLRRLIRRASLHGLLLGIDGPFLQEPVEAVIGVRGGYWNELEERRGHILRVIGNEEQRFLQTLSRGLALFEEAADQAAAGGGVITGDQAFTLSDTHGFPLELTRELAAERNLTVDEEAFAAALQSQKERAQRARQLTLGQTSPEAYIELSRLIPPTVFTGYEELRTTSEIVGILAEGEPVVQARSGDEVEIVLAATPFYAESGGQVGDTGVIFTDAATVQVIDTQRPVPSLIVHKARVVEGAINVGDATVADVDAERRLHILPHHSGTHLLHKALQEVLGLEATQAGSLVAPDRLRFDFRWPRPMTAEEIREVQDRVNAAIWANLPVRRENMQYDDAISLGAMALFGEKYGDRVRVVSMGDWSKELCGGTHVNATGDIGLLIITSETGIGSGTRRIEALAGAAAYTYVNDLRDHLGAVASTLETAPDHLPSRAQTLMDESRERDRRIEQLTRQLAAREAEALVRGSIDVDGFTVVADEIRADSVDFLQATVDAVRSRLDRGIVVLGSVVEGKPAFTMAVTRNLSGEGYQANQLLREAAKVAQGGAGGNPEFAQGGGRDASKVGDVVRTAVELIRRKAEK